ncbi:MAG: UDP-N-acetylglucosamine--N-acetylmuramyl-(pentapeptide) pyrophosphoryl-undecaprenol N-acetylglucosamine transferase [Candidatus Magasanikbacteria bacterium]|nr:UDP-N-acetylglucosamine--N-acetylmuramyl-(pentapeptide) pyrophosphoryl-undecaprenol N-acetylglucosamine transferase [Candidatus Magasanikbacteria bacterium]
MKIILSGGGTLGPVTPLLAIQDIIKRNFPDTEFVWVGTKSGPEKELVEKRGIKFVTISSGKLRRYISIWNIADIFRIFIGLFQSIKIIWRENPNFCISAGGFISVPIHWAAWLLGVSSWIHQQDAVVGLSNKLMSPFAIVITTALAGNVKKFNKRKTFWLGNPVRREILAGSRERAFQRFNLKSGLPVVFATGGGTGSMRVNQLIIQAVPELKDACQIIHLSGKERPQDLVDRAVQHFGEFYQVHQFFSEAMADAYVAADLVISRGGFGTISELAALAKPAILIPKPGHQEENVGFLAEAGAVVLVDERTADGNYLAKIIKELLSDSAHLKQMGEQLQKMLPVAREEDVVGVVKVMV